MAKKEKYQLEVEIKSSPRILYKYISTPSGLENWFADKVNAKGELYVFTWKDSEAQAKLLSKKENSFARYKWVDNGDESETFFQFDIVQDDITSDVALVITDFSLPEDVEEDKFLWSAQVNKLMHLLGS